MNTTSLFAQDYVMETDTIYKLNIYHVKNHVLTFFAGAVKNIKDIEFDPNEPDVESFVCRLFKNMQFFVPLNAGVGDYDDVEFIPARMMKKIHKDEFTKEFELYDAYFTIAITKIYGKFLFVEYDSLMVESYFDPIGIKQSCFNNNKTVVIKKILAPIKFTKSEKIQLDSLFQ